MSDVLFAYGECAYIDVVAGTGCIHSMEATVANVGKRKVEPVCDVSLQARPLALQYQHELTKGSPIWNVFPHSPDSVPMP